MNKVNFDSLKHIKAPQEWLDKAAAIPETAVQKRPAFPIFRVATAAGVVLVSVIGLLTFLFFGNQAPITIREKASEEVQSTEADGSVPIPDGGSYPSLDTVLPTVPQVVPTDVDGNPAIEPATKPTTAREKQKSSATEPTENVRPTQNPVKATELTQKPTQGAPSSTEAPVPPTTPTQQPTEDHGEVVAGNLCFTAVFPASLIEEGEPIYFMYWEHGVDYPSVAMDYQAQYTVMDNGMVFAVYETDIILPEGPMTYEYQFYQNGRVLAQGTQVV